MFQDLIILSPATVSKVLPSEARDAQCRAVACPFKVWRQLPDCTSHTMAQPSAATDTAVIPSGPTLMQWTLPAWFWSSSRGGACRSHTLAVLSSEPVIANLQQIRHQGVSMRALGCCNRTAGHPLWQKLKRCDEITLCMTAVKHNKQSTWRHMNSRHNQRQEKEGTFDD